MRGALKQLATLPNGWGDGTGEAFLTEELYLADEWLSFMENCLQLPIKISAVNEIKSIDFELGDVLFGFFDFSRNNFFLSYREAKEIDCQINEISADVLRDILH